MKIKYENNFCEKCDNEEAFKKIGNLRRKLLIELKKKHNLPENWAGSFFDHNDQNIIDKEFEEHYKQRCIIIESEEEDIILCKKHFTELLERFE